MTDDVYTPVLSAEAAQRYLDRVYQSQIDEIPRADLGGIGPRQIPLTPARQAALAVFSALRGRKGLDLHEIVDDVYILGEIVDEATDIIGQAFNLGKGPVNVGVAFELNKMHATGSNWELAYDAKKKQFTAVVETPTGGLECAKADHLYEAIRVAQFERERSK